MTRPILLSWSSGKDSTWALHVLRQDPRYEVRGLLTTLNEDNDRVAMHGVRGTLLRAQAAAAELPLLSVPLPPQCSNAVYEQRIARAVEDARQQHAVTAIAFGDLFLADIRKYREQQMTALGLEALFPLWGEDTKALAGKMLTAGLKAVLTCIDLKACPREFAGCEFDRGLLDRLLPAGIDPCGENGEFHTFAYAGPPFAKAIPVRRGETVERDGFVFADLFGA